LSEKCLKHNLTQSLEEDKQHFINVSLERLKQRQSNYALRKANLTATKSSELEPIDETDILASFDSQISQIRGEGLQS
jgi:hypothetical protein